MRIALLVVVALISLGLVGTALAVPPTKTLEFPGGAMGKVTFSGKVHADKGLKCMDCHTKIFPMKGPGKEGSAKFTMADINAGKFCGTCHNGTKAFAPKDNCAKCHKK